LRFQFGTSRLMKCIYVFKEGKMSQIDLIRVERSIRIIRGDKVIFDEDLAEL